jgi:hypothetical protein
MLCGNHAQHKHPPPTISARLIRYAGPTNTRISGSTKIRKRYDTKHARAIRNVHLRMVAAGYPQDEQVFF